LIKSGFFIDLFSIFLASLAYFTRKDISTLL
jgi:hypothetical protein